MRHPSITAFDLVPIKRPGLTLTNHHRVSGQAAVEIERERGAVAGVTPERVCDDDCRTGRYLAGIGGGQDIFGSRLVLVKHLKSAAFGIADIVRIATRQIINMSPIKIVGFHQHNGGTIRTARDRGEVVAVKSFIRQGDYCIGEKMSVIHPTTGQQCAARELCAIAINPNI